MFSVVYEFKVSQQNEEEFKKIWHQLTLIIKETRGGLGSRLHKDINREGVWIAYAQWADKETWGNNSPFTHPHHIALQTSLISICDGIGIVYELEVADDLLGENAFSSKRH